MGTTTIEGLGTFDYADDLYTDAMNCTQTFLAAEMLEREGNISLNKSPSAIKKMRKSDLAAILAAWDTEKRNRIEDAVVAAGKAKQATIKRHTCGCGQLIEVLENGTFKRHTRHNTRARRVEIEKGVAPQRVRCLSSGQFPISVIHMREDTNNRDRDNKRPLTYASTRIDLDLKAFRLGTRSGSRRARKSITKNRHRANYGKRFQVSA